MRLLILPAVALGALALAACGDDRSAEAQGDVAEAEVETELPEEMISDEELQDIADQAAAGAASSTVPMDPDVAAATTDADPGATTPPAQ